MLLLVPMFIFAVYLLGGLGSGLYLGYQYLRFVSRKQKRTPWSVVLGTGWFLFAGGLVIGLGVSPFLDLPQRPNEPTALAAVCNVSIILAFGVWVVALFVYLAWNRHATP